MMQSGQRMPIQATPAEVESLGLSFSYQLAAERTAPLIFMVHGREGNQGVMWAFNRVIDAPTHRVAPQAPMLDEGGGWSWWKVGAPDLREQISSAATTLAQFMRNTAGQFNLEPRRVLAVGFSQGAGLLSLIAQEHPELLDGVALLAGFVLESEQSNIRPGLPVFAAHGTEDPVVPIARARRGIEFLNAQGASAQLVEDRIAHKVGIQGMHALKDWFAAQLTP